MSTDRTSVRDIDWLEVFPWLGLSRAIPLAWGPGKLLLALAGIMLTTAGWGGIAGVYSYYRPDDEQIKAQKAAARQAEPWDQHPPVDLSGLRPGALRDGATSDASAPDRVREARPIGQTLIDAGASAGRSVAALPAWYTRPFWPLFADDIRWPAFGMAGLGALWALAVWAFFGGAITRQAAVRLAQDRRLGFLAACRYAMAKWMSYFGGPLFPLGGVLLLLVVPALVAGWVSRLDAGFAFVGALWIFGLIAGLICAVLLVAGLLGWPLMWAAVSTDSSDAFKSFSDSFSYVTQRPFHLAFYVLVAGLMGAAAWIVVAAIGELTIYLVAWGVSWGSGAERARQIFEAAAGVSSLSDAAGSTMVARWSTLVRMLVLAYGHSYLWTAASGIYLLLRHDTDGTPMDEVYLDSAEDPYGLPPVRRDAAGVTVLDENRPQPVGTK